MNRQGAATYLAGTMAELLTDAGLGNEDDPGQLAEVIDDALLFVGVAESDLPTADVTTNVLGFRLVLRYALMLRIDGARGDRPSSFSEGGVNASWSRDGWAKSLEAARVAAAPFMIGIDSGAWQLANLRGDWIEPMQVWS